MLEGGFGKPVIPQDPVLIITQCEQGFGRVRLESLRTIQSTFRCIATSDSGVGTKVKMCVHTRKPRPSERKIAVNLYCPLIRIDGCLCCSIEEAATGFKSQAAQIRIVSLRVVCRFNCQGLLLAAGEFRLQLLRNRFSELTFYAQDVSEFAIVGVGPQMRIAGCLDEVHADADCVASFLNATLKNVCHTKLLRDLGEVARFALLLLRRSARNDFQVRDLRESREDFLLNTIRKISVGFVLAKVCKGQHRDRFGHCVSRHTWLCWRGVC